MAESRFKPVKKEELAALVERAIKTSVGFYDSKLSKERQEVLDYYNGKKPAPIHAGNSKYVSMDVWDSVESMKAVLLETFAAGNKIVGFDPQGPDDVEDAATATEYCDFVVHRQNDAFHIFGDTIQDGLMARVGVVKAYWDKIEVEEHEEFSNVEMDVLEALAQDPDIVDVEAEETYEGSGLFDGELTRRVDKSQVRLDVIPPEEFLITPQSTTIAAAPFVAHRTRKTFAELIALGYPKDKVAKIGAEDDAELTMDPEFLARHEGIGAERLNLDGEVQEQSKYVMVYECYMNLDMEGTGRTKLYKITKCGGVVLDHEEVNSKPFEVFTPLPVAHAFYGSNYAHKVIPTQNARTVLMRGILDHTVLTNNPRYTVVKGAVTNPKELLENRFGGIVNVTRPDGIAPFPQASLNPFIFQTLQLLDEDKEEVTGVSRLSQGLNKDAVSKQNSQASLNDMVSLSQQREKIIARQFASFVKRLYLKVYELVLANERSEKIIQVAGQFKRISPSDWRERVDMSVELKLGYGEQAREAEKFMAINAMLTQDPDAKAFFDVPQKHALYTDIVQKMGVKNSMKYLKPLEQIQPPQPDPMMVKQVELEERKVAAQEMVSQASAKKVDMNAQLEQMRIEMQRMKDEMEAMHRDRELDRKEYEVSSKNAIAVEELEMLRNQATNSPENATAIISPNA